MRHTGPVAAAGLLLGLGVHPAQADPDEDGVGELCDVCPGVQDPGQEDGDGDGAGDACECQPLDPNDREPAEVLWLTAARSGSDGAALSWTAAAGAEVYSLTRAPLSALAPGQYGPCLAEDLEARSYEDLDPPPAGDGYGYLVQGQSFDCGLGPLGYTSAEEPRDNLALGACGGHPHTDAYAEAEDAVYGSVSGTYLATQASDDVRETITEELSGGNPQNRLSRLEQRWTVTVAPGSRVALHVEAFRTASPDGDVFVFDYSTDGGSTWLPVSVPTLPQSDDGIDRIGELPANLSGTLLIRVVDTDRTAGNQDLDSVSVDELFVRSVP